MTPEEFLQLRPAFHFDHEGKPISWAIGPDVLEFLGQKLSPESTTLETGSGVSTVFFAINRCRHIAISPDAREFDSIRAFCEKEQVPLEKVEFVASRSELWLPKADLPALDLVLIDGRHGFPSPSIDWFYSAEALKVGGWMVVDDTQLHTGKVLSDFMQEDTRWKTIEILPKTSVFEKIDPHVHAGEWNEQPYIARLSGWTG